MTRGSKRVGSGDLVRALALAGSQVDRSRIAAFLAFEFDARRVQADRSSEGPERGTASEQLATGKPAPTFEPAPIDPELPTPLWRLDAIEFMARADEDAAPVDAAPEVEPLTAAELGRVSDVRVPPTPLVPWPRLRRALEGIWKRPEVSDEVDVDALVDAIGRGQPIVRIPRKSRPLHGRRLIVAVDLAERLIPFRSDMREVLMRIADESGVASLELVELWRGPPRRGSDAQRVDAIAERLGEGDAVLVLGDLGHHAAPPLRAAWARLGAALVRRGVEASALVPCPASRWDADVSGTWRMIDWAHPHHRVGRAKLGEAQLETRRDDLLALLSWFVRIEPELLRDVRAALPADVADVGTEADVWNHPEVIRQVAGMVIPEALRKRGWARLQAMMADPRWQPRVAKVVEAARRRKSSAVREVWLDELRMLQSLDAKQPWILDEEVEAIVEFTRRVSALVAIDPEAARGLGESIDMLGWIARSNDTRLPREAWQHPQWGPALCEIYGRVLDVPGKARPEGLDESMLPAKPGKLELLRRWSVHHVHEGLYVAPADGIGPGMSSPLVTVWARTARIQVGQQPYELGAAGVLTIPDADTLTLSTDCVRATMKLGPRPAWAHAHGRDEFGLWASFRVGEVEQRMRWIPPGRFMMGSPDSEIGREGNEGPQHRVVIAEGFWLADTPCTQALWVAVMGYNPSKFPGERRPVEWVSANEVDTLIGRLNRFTKNDIFKLPHEHEWEYACRAETSAATYVGDLRASDKDPLLDRIAWYSGNAGGKTHDVAQKLPNPWGLYDMLGNVHEWTRDSWRDYSKDPTTGQNRAYRGGSWHGYAHHVRAAFRHWLEPVHRDGSLGFRLACGQEPQEQATTRARAEAGPGDPDAARRARERK